MRLNKLSLIFAILAFITLAVCGSMVFGAKSGGDASLYFPLTPDNTWLYKVSITGNVSNSFQEKIKVDDPENGYQKIILYENEKPSVFIYYVENEQGLFKVKEMNPSEQIDYNPLMKVLSSKMDVGTTWSWESSDHKMKETDKVLGTEKVTVTAGTFDTILIQCEGIGIDGSNYVVKTWYAKGVGYVKDETTIGGNTILTELTEYHVVN